MSANNIFCASNPAKIVDALWQVLTNKISARESATDDFSNDIIFLPSRRAVGTVERMIAEKTGAAVLLPRLVALGEEAEDDGPQEDKSEKGGPGAPVSNLERAAVLAKMLTAHMDGGIAGTLPVAKDLVRTMDYLENERNADRKTEINWSELVCEKYAVHFRDKARFLDLACRALPLVFPGRETVAQKRNKDVRGWIEYLNKHKSRIIVCGSTGSVPATADLMEYIAGRANGYIILPGKINEIRDTLCEIRDTNPYYSEMKFLERICVMPTDVQTIDVGESAIGFFNSAFDNNTNHRSQITNHDARFTRVDCAREAEEMETVAEIAKDAASSGKTVLIVSPDKAAAQRLRESLIMRSVEFDFSIGMSGGSTKLGRLVLNMLDEGKGKRDGGKGYVRDICAEYKKTGDLFGAVQNMVEDYVSSRAPLCGDPVSCQDQGLEDVQNNEDSDYLQNDKIPGSASRPRDDTNRHSQITHHDITSEESLAVWDAVREVSDIIKNNRLELSKPDLRGLVAEALDTVNIRPPGKEGCPVCILGTIESRMQTADVVILTGLNENMFPATGYENPWLPRRVCDALGMPPPERKVSLMAMDFITLSCGGDVYWTRSKTSGGYDTTESRFLSRVSVKENKGKEILIDDGSEWLARVRARDSVPLRPLDYLAPKPNADWSDVFVTELELLVHNPYAFYARHILRLRPSPDPWDDASAIDFGNIVHEAIKELTISEKDTQCRDIIEILKQKAKEKLEPGSILFHFWDARFKEMAPLVKEFIDEAKSDDVVWSAAEDAATGVVEIAGRNVRAKADCVYVKREEGRGKREEIGCAIDIKTGRVPSNSQLDNGMMPQLPLEAYMLKNKKFTGQNVLPARVVMKFLQLSRGKCGVIEYAGEDLDNKIGAAIAKTTELFNMYSAGGKAYEYRETGDDKYKAYDDLARAWD
ncbi:MAG: PD-(D/E)XK nuclease family protein [Rickettsiales bacterium]|nr:PD-(D/E)XK nuclease family protein [Rickettsiales bacterium]